MTDDLRLGAVRTILASGNAIFEAEGGTATPAALASSIEAALRTRFSYDARIVLVSRAEVQEAIADPVARGRGVIYWNPVRGTTTDTPFAKLLSRRIYRATTTNRNLRTLEKIVAG